jgi:hypothetical protein
MTRRRVLGALLVLLLVAFLLVRLVPDRGSHPPIVIRAQGGDQPLTRSVLASSLEKLFPKGNGTWKLESPVNEDPSSRCVALSAGYRKSEGRAVTADYQFAGWLQVRLADYAYPHAADAVALVGKSSAAADAAASHAAAVCEGKMLAEVLRRSGYSLGKPRAFPSSTVQVGVGRSIRIEIPTLYRGRRYNWDLDSTSVRTGRTVLVVETLTPESFLRANEALASELVWGSG